MEVEMPPRGHRYATGLERKPFPSPDCDLAIVDGIAENGPGQRNLAQSQSSFPSNGAGEV